MSTIQSQIALIHVNSQLSASSALLRESFESGFSSDSISVSSTEEAVTLGDITTPRQVFLKLVSGDPVQVGLATNVYPLRLNDADESMLLRLDVEGKREISCITAVADVAGSLGGLYFDLTDRLGPVRVWFDVANGSSAPAIPEGGRLVEVDIASGATAEAVATALETALNADAEFTTSRNVAVLDITDQHTGTRTDISAGTSTMTVSRQQEGAASPTVYLKSTGTSQVVVAVAPN